MSLKNPLVDCGPTACCSSLALEDPSAQATLVGAPGEAVASSQRGHEVQQCTAVRWGWCWVALLVEWHSGTVLQPRYKLSGSAVLVPGCSSTCALSPNLGGGTVDVGWRHKAQGGKGLQEHGAHRHCTPQRATLDCRLFISGAKSHPWWVLLSCCSSCSWGTRRRRPRTRCPREM